MRIKCSHIFKAHRPFLAHGKLSSQDKADLVKVMGNARLYLKKLKILVHQ